VILRSISHRYTDPLDLVWLASARDVGLTIVRSDSVYASFDGEGTLTLSTPEHFDPDDSLAQLIFHELCHALVAGPKRAGRPDWGMENSDERDLVQEQACHRLQAALADKHGLRTFFAVTTDWRPYWDTLPIDPLGPGEDPAIPLAREAYERATEGPWASALDTALSRTRAIAEIVRATRPDPSELWALTRPLHASRFPLSDRRDARCGDCAWSFSADGLRCRQTRRLPSQRGKRINAADQACVRFEAKLDAAECGRCGACCREAFDRVEVSPREAIRKRHPELIVRDVFGPHLPRPQGRCVALAGDGCSAPYLCRIYEDRPKSCADFAIAGDACLEARRRVGLSG
jgi:hypothetical protein